MHIKGVGMTKFSTEENNSTHIIYESAMEALDDSGLSMNEIDAVVLSNNDIISNGERQRHSASLLSSLFQKKMPIIAVPAGCAGGGTALWAAVRLQKSKNYNNLLVIGFEKMVSNLSKRVTDEMLMGTERIYEQNEGMNFPAENALVAQQYMMKCGATSDDLALVALKTIKMLTRIQKRDFTEKKSI